jgi:hypothetical protein
MYVWKGKRSSRLLRAAASRLVPQLESMEPRPDHLVLTEVTEGHEQVTDSLFCSLVSTLLHLCG